MLVCKGKDLRNGVVEGCLKLFKDELRKMKCKGWLVWVGLGLMLGIGVFWVVFWEWLVFFEIGMCFLEGLEE